MLEKTLEQSIEQCLEKRMDGSCRSHPPYESDLLLWTGKTYDPTTHQIKSRISPQYNLTLKQGLAAKGNGTTAKADYGVLNLCQSGSGWTKNLRIIFEQKYDNAASPVCGEYRSLAGKRGWAIISSNKVAISIYLGSSDGNSAVTPSITYTNALSDFDRVEIVMKEVGGVLVITAYRNGTANGTTTVNDRDRIYCNGAEFLAFNYNHTTAYSLNTMTYLEILRDDATVFRTHCNGTLIDEVTGTIPTTVGMSFVRSNNSTYRNDEYGFAVKSGVIYPKLLDGSGYAGLVGDPDAVYHGLIATKGQPEIGTKQYLGTEYDFGDAVAITDAGISWDKWDGEDTNLDTVGTAETDLDTDYYNAITANLMTNTSIAGYAGTSNVSKRLFFKVADRVMKGDGSFRAESGRVQEILVYKRDLSASEILRVQKYCREVV